MRLLLDEHLWPGLADIISAARPEVDIISIHQFEDGALVNQSDARILQKCREEGRILVTFDVNTIPAEIARCATNGQDHAGVVFLSTKSFAQNDYKSLTKALTALVEMHRNADWTNRTLFLSKARPA
jgi:predicted nuclease of predicted toxin-antitoxin system